jgi:hypothetical protein
VSKAISLSAIRRTVLRHALETEIASLYEIVAEAVEMQNQADVDTYSYELETAKALLEMVK